MTDSRHFTLDRRRFMTLAGTGLASLAMAAWPSAAPGAAPPRHAKSCILIWLNGGPSHIDTFDPKAGRPVAGPFKAIKTSAPQVMLSEHLPQIAAQAHRLAICRGMTSKEGNHVR